MPAKIKLTYFNAKGRAELARLVLAQAGAEYDDVRIEEEEWPSHKPSKPFQSSNVYKAVKTIIYIQSVMLFSGLKLSPTSKATAEVDWPINETSSIRLGPLS